MNEKQVETHKNRVRLMPPASNLTRGEELIPRIPNEETLAEYDRLVKEEELAISKRREIIAKLTSQNQPRLK